MIYHISSQDTWQKALNLGFYTADSLDREGFIHCSNLEQLAGVANTFYRGQHNLILLVIDPEKLNSPLVWEVPSHPTKEDLYLLKSEKIFPHIYGNINLEAVVNILPLAPEIDGSFRLDF